MSRADRRGDARGRNAPDAAATRGAGRSRLEGGPDARVSVTGDQRDSLGDFLGGCLRAPLTPRVQEVPKVDIFVSCARVRNLLAFLG